MSDTVLDRYSSPPTDPDANLLLDPYPGQKTARHVKLAVSWQPVAGAGAGGGAGGNGGTPVGIGALAGATVGASADTGAKAIARDLAPHLRSLTYTDNLSGAADDLELEDREELWAGNWQPQFGDTVQARLEARRWFALSKEQLSKEPTAYLKVGTFAHDKISISGPPHIVALQCVSAPLATGLRRRKRTRVWQGVDLKTIAADIAKRAPLTLDFDGDPGTKYTRVVQNDKSDLEFLQELCLLLDGRLGIGYVLGCFYTDSDAPPLSDDAKRSLVGDDLRLGAADASDKIALAPKVKDELDKIKDELTKIKTTLASIGGGITSNAMFVTTYTGSYSPEDVAAANVSAK